jgi:hypothetical protein
MLALSGDQRGSSVYCGTEGVRSSRILELQCTLEQQKEKQASSFLVNEQEKNHLSLEIFDL